MQALILSLHIPLIRRVGSKCQKNLNVVMLHIKLKEMNIDQHRSFDLTYTPDLMVGLNGLMLILYK